MVLQWYWRRRPLISRPGPKAHNAAFALLMGSYVAWFGLRSVLIHDGYGTFGYDLGIFDQGVWLLSRFHAPFVTVMGRDLFGDHTSFVLLLVVPLYWLGLGARALLVTQTVLLAASAVPVYLLGLRRCGRSPATMVAGAYLLNPFLQGGNLEQFHPECFLAFGAAWAVWAAVEWRPPVLVVACVLCLLAKEDAALIVAGLGVWVALRRSGRAGLGLVAAAAAWCAFAYGVVIEALLGTVSFYSGRIPFGGLSGLLVAPFAHPGRFFSYCCRGGRPFYGWQLLASAGLLVDPGLALVSALAVAENVLSTLPYMHQVGYHYSLALVPLLALATVVAMARLASPRTRIAAASWVLGCAVGACWLWGSAPFSRVSLQPPLPAGGPAARAADRALAAVPAAAVVAADAPYVAHLAHRLRIYQYPTPFRAHYWGLYRQEGRPLPAAGSVGWVVIACPPSSAPPVAFALVTRGGGACVYRRVPRVRP